MINICSVDERKEPKPKGINVPVPRSFEWLILDYECDISLS